MRPIETAALEYVRIVDRRKLFVIKKKLTSLYQRDF